MPGRRHEPHEIDRGLTLLALHGGNAAHAAHAADIPERTLQDWKHKHADRYEQLRTTLAPRIAERIASEAEALAVQYAKAETLALNRAVQGMDDMKPAEAAAAARNLATAKALQIDKISSPLRGRPSLVIERREPAAILNSVLQRFGITSTAQDITNQHELPTTDALLREAAPVNARDGNA